jgi:hypothetical protein
VLLAVAAVAGVGNAISNRAAGGRVRFFVTT